MDQIIVANHVQNACGIHYRGLRQRDQTNYVYGNDDQGKVFQIVNFMTYKVRFVVLVRISISEIYRKFIISIRIFSTPGHGSGKLLLSNTDQERFYQN